MAQCRPKNNTMTKKANKYGNGIAPVQTHCHQKSVNLAKPTEISRGSMALTIAVNAQERAIEAFMLHASRENFLWEREATKLVEKLRREKR